MKKKEIDDVRARVLACLQYLGGETSRRRGRDGVGFNRHDERFGSSLASKHWLTFRQMEHGARLCRKYRKQLVDGGLVPPSEEDVRRYLEAHKTEVDAEQRRRLVQQEEQQRWER